MTTYLLERALIDGVVREDVRVEIAGGRFVQVSPVDRGNPHLTAVATPIKCQEPRSTGDPGTRIPGITMAGIANTHSHAFHRALRGRTQAARGSFWTWRDQMYAVAASLDPDALFALARATYREMVASGITCVGEFHYLHHRPDGTPYDDPNAMGAALIAAAREAGLRITLLDALYLSSGFGAPPTGTQRRYSDGDVDAWAARRAELITSDGPDDLVVGAALHSVRAVPATAFPRFREVAADRPLHVHLSEQVAENDACRAAYGVTPTRLLADHGLLGPHTSAVHATHLTDDDIALLGATASFAAFCPTTERDLGDGIGPSVALRDAGARLTLGSDSHAVIDPFEEMRAVEMHERLARQQRGHWTATALLAAATYDGHASLGFPDAGRIAVGQRADLVTLDLTSPRTAGTGADEHTVVFAAGSADVTSVIVGGRQVFTADDRLGIGLELDAAVRAVTEGAS